MNSSNNKYTNNDRICLDEYITVTVWFGCNNDCMLCMLSDLKKTLRPISFQRFQEILAEICEDGRYKNLILSGAEVTTFPELNKYVQYAASLHYFQKIQIQTNGRRLADIEYLRHLIQCGVNEFFISIQGLERTHDAITRRKGSFEQTWSGLQNLRAFGANVITNTVVTKWNIHEIVPLLRILPDQGISEIHVWNFFPMAEYDHNDSLVRLGNVCKLFPQLFEIGTSFHIPIVLKNIPHCLSTAPPLRVDSLLAETLIPERYWEAFARNQFGLCVYRENKECRSEHCWGLSRAYVRKYGYEEHLLQPVRR